MNDVRHCFGETLVMHETTCGVRGREIAEALHALAETVEERDLLLRTITLSSDPYDETQFILQMISTT